MSYLESDPLLASNYQNWDHLVENSRRKSYICGLVNFALLLANVNQFKQMVKATKGQEQILFITAFSITIALQLVLFFILFLDARLLSDPSDTHSRSTKRTTILLCISIVIIIIDMIAITVTDDWNNEILKYTF